MKSERRPPKLDVVRRVPLQKKDPTARVLLTQEKVCGKHPRLGRSEILDVMRRVSLGQEQALCGIEPFSSLTDDEVARAVESIWGWTHKEPYGKIDPRLVVPAMQRAMGRLANSALAGARIAFATTRPASLLPVMARLASFARACGAEVLIESQTGEIRADGRAGRRLRWVNDVAVLTDGDSLLATNGVEAGEELLFFLPRPQLVVADGGIAGAAFADKLQVVSFSDLDMVALGVAAVREPDRMLAVPLVTTQPPSAYGPLLDGGLRPPGSQPWPAELGPIGRLHPSVHEAIEGVA